MAVERVGSAEGNGTVAESVQIVGGPEFTWPMLIAIDAIISHSENNNLIDQAMATALPMALPRDLLNRNVEYCANLLYANYDFLSQNPADVSRFYTVAASEASKFVGDFTTFAKDSQRSNFASMQGVSRAPRGEAVLDPGARMSLSQGDEVRASMVARLPHLTIGTRAPSERLTALTHFLAVMLQSACHHSDVQVRMLVLHQNAEFKRLKDRDSTFVLGDFVLNAFKGVIPKYVPQIEDPLQKNREPNPETDARIFAVLRVFLPLKQAVLSDVVLVARVKGDFFTKDQVSVVELQEIAYKIRCRRDMNDFKKLPQREQSLDRLNQLRIQYGIKRASAGLSRYYSGSTAEGVEFEIHRSEDGVLVRYPSLEQAGMVAFNMLTQDSHYKDIQAFTERLNLSLETGKRSLAIANMRSIFQATEDRLYKEILPWQKKQINEMRRLREVVNAIYSLLSSGLFEANDISFGKLKVDPGVELKLIADVRDAVRKIDLGKASVVADVSRALSQPGLRTKLFGFLVAYQQLATSVEGLERSSRDTQAEVLPLIEQLQRLLNGKTVKDLLDLTTSDQLALPGSEERIPLGPNKLIDALDDWCAQIRDVRCKREKELPILEKRIGDFKTFSSNCLLALNEAGLLNDLAKRISIDDADLIGKVTTWNRRLVRLFLDVSLPMTAETIVHLFKQTFPLIAQTAQQCKLYPPHWYINQLNWLLPVKDAVPVTTQKQVHIIDADQTVTVKNTLGYITCS